MGEPTVGSWKSTSLIALSMITIIQVLFGLLVGARFGINFPRNVLTSDFGEAPVFDPNSTITIIVQFLFSLVLLLTYPGCILIAREYCESIWVLFAKSRDGLDLNEDEPEPELDENGEPLPGKYEVSRCSQIIIAAVLVLLTAPFLFFPEAGVMCDNILDMVGGFACGFMAFVLPSLCFWAVYGFCAAEGENRDCMDKVLPLIIFIFGCCGCLLQLFNMVNEFGGLEWGFLDNSMPDLPQG